MVNINKIRTLCKGKGLKMSYLASKLGLKNSYFADVANGKNTMSAERISFIANLLGTTYEYLTDRTDDPDRHGVKIKVFGDVAAGIPIEQIDNFDPSETSSWEEITNTMARNGDYFALRIKGDSMTPEMREGDVVIVRYQQTAESGDIAVVAVNGDLATCKKIKRDKQGIYLISLNTNYEPMFYSNQQIEELPITILGKVVEIRRAL